MKKKVLFLLFLAILTLNITGCGKEETKKNTETYKIGRSNKKDDTKLQIKVIIDKINIREEPSASSEKLGEVEKGSIFTVLEYKEDERFIWFKIETENHISGYIASDKESPYVESNREIDIKGPTITIKSNTITVSTRQDIEKAVRENVSLKDEIDPNPKLDYSVDYNDRMGDFQYRVTATATDSSNNSSSIKFIVKITSEKQVKDGKWITYKEMVAKQKQANSLCKKYGLVTSNGAVGCRNNSYTIHITSGGSSIQMESTEAFCSYGNELKPAGCYDGKGNSVDHDLMPDKWKKLENIWLPKFEKYLEDVKNTTGYELSELKWD